MRIRLLALSIIAVTLVPLVSQAQCPNVGGSPQAEQYAANKLKLAYLPSGPGGGDDRPALFKSLFMAPSLTFDPINTHSVRVRFLKNGNQANVMWDVTIPPNATWVQSGIKWIYIDNTAPFGVNRIRIHDLGGGTYLIVFFRGVNQSVAFAPVLAGTDNVTVEVQVYDGSNVGVCYGGSTDACSGNGNTQVCRVQ